MCNVQIYVQPSHWLNMGMLHVMSLADAKSSKSDMEKEKPNLNLNFGHLKRLGDEEKEEILSKKSAKNTNDATKQWVKCFTDYLEEKGLLDIVLITNADLPDILLNFYTKVPKKKPEDESDPDSGNYKTSSLKALRTGLTRYFKDNRNIDIIKNECFNKTNDMYVTITKVNKEHDLGTCRPGDLDRLHQIYNACQSRPKGLTTDCDIQNHILSMSLRKRESVKNDNQHLFL